ncbi:MAG: AI-2E family transporter [Spirochaetota bacterium]|nr:AI-2E family transporter [Spirochaetota bacterium]
MIEKRDSFTTLKQNKKLTILFLIIFFIVTFSLIYIYRVFFWPFIFACIFYIALRPVYDWVTKYIKNRLIGSLLVTIFLFMIVLIPLFFIMLSLADQFYEFYLFLHQKINIAFINDFIKKSDITKTIFSFFNIEESRILQEVINFLQKSSLQIFSNITTVLTFSIRLSINIFFMLLILFFLFKDGYRLEESLYSILPFPEDIEKDIIERLKQVIKILIAGNMLVMFLQGLAVGLAFYLFGIGMSLLAGSIAAVFSLIPIVSTAFVWIPACVYLLVIGEYLYAILMGTWCLFWYITLENLFKPKFFGTTLNFHPLLFFFLLLGSIQAFNLPGLIIGPILLVLFYSLWEIYKLLNVYDDSSE